MRIDDFDLNEISSKLAMREENEEGYAMNAAAVGGGSHGDGHDDITGAGHGDGHDDVTGGVGPIQPIATLS
jgi:hypothetical protein